MPRKGFWTKGNRPDHRKPDKGRMEQGPSGSGQMNGGPSGNGNGNGNGNGGGGGGGKPASILSKPYQGTGLTIGAMDERSLSTLQRQGDLAGARAREDAQGTFDEFFDANDPYSRQALAARTLSQELERNRNQAGASGHLYSGGLQATDKESVFQGSMNQDQLFREYAARQQQTNRDLGTELNDLSRQGDDLFFQAQQNTSRDMSTTPTLQFGRRGKGKNKKKK